MRIYTSRKRNRTWVGVLAGCLGVYLVLAVGYHWLLQPTVAKNAEALVSRLSPGTLPAFPDRRPAEPTTLEQPGRGAAQRPVAPSLAPAAETAPAAPSEQAERAERAVEIQNVQDQDGFRPTYGSQRSGVSGVQWQSSILRRDLIGRPLQIGARLPIRGLELAAPPHCAAVGAFSRSLAVRAAPAGQSSQCSVTPISRIPIGGAGLGD